MRHDWLMTAGIAVALWLTSSIFLPPAHARDDFWLPPAQTQGRSSASTQTSIRALASTTQLVYDNSRELFNDLVATMHHQRDDAGDANAEVTAVLTAGALQGQAHALHTLVERNRMSIAEFRTAVTMFERDLQRAESRIFRGHVTKEVRRDFQEMQSDIQNLRRQLENRRSEEHHDDDYDRYDDY